MKVVGWMIGVVALGGLIVLAIAGVTAAIGVLVTAAAIVGMIALGNMLGGRTTPDREPYEVGSGTESPHTESPHTESPHTESPHCEGPHPETGM